MTVLGTRPEIIRLSRIIPLLDEHSDHVLAHTGQNFTDSLSSIFFKELEVRDPDVHMGVRAESFAGQIAQILVGAEQLLIEHRPDRVLILGDTNSGLVSIVAKRLGIPVYHMEAGNRCYDDRVPEEVNRRIIDHSSDVLMPYTHRSKENLLREGIAPDRIYVTGNPIKQVMDYYADRISASSAVAELGLESRGYFLVTMHRAENVDDAERLKQLLAGLDLLQVTYRLPIVVSVHPRTRSKMHTFGLSDHREGFAFLEPLGFFDFLRLEREAFCVLSDSGTVQEEACILGVPNVTIRDVTERPETVEAGSNVLAGSDPETVRRLVDFVVTSPTSWTPPLEYIATSVAQTVVRITLGYNASRPEGTP
jgi:UDP-N-acetylglucosamine 2-epimerase (non-hydrolysing)